MKVLDVKKAQQCITLSEQLLELAQQGEWQQFEQMMQQRDKLITQLVAKDYPANEAGAVRHVIGRIKSFDSLTLPLAEAAKQQTLSDIRGESKKKKGVSAYKKARREY
ncbi:MAG: flagellar protein FliT [Motiliproteus sp.]